MDLSDEIKQSIDKSVLCWLATVSNEQVPNVSPKEVFNYFGREKLIIANIASPGSVRNILHNAKVCVSFIDILVQKGFQLKGTARIISAGDSDFSEPEKVLLKITEGKFPFKSIIEISIESAKPIVAPKYWLFPGTTEEEQVESAKKIYFK